LAALLQFARDQEDQLIFKRFNLGFSWRPHAFDGAGRNAAALTRQSLRRGAVKNGARVVGPKFRHFLLRGARRAFAVGWCAGGEGQHEGERKRGFCDHDRESNPLCASGATPSS